MDLIENGEHRIELIFDNYRLVQENDYNEIKLTKVDKEKFIDREGFNFLDEHLNNFLLARDFDAVEQKKFNYFYEYAAIAKNDNKEIAIKVFREKKEDEPIIKLQQSKSKKLIRKIKHLI